MQLQWSSDFRDWATGLKFEGVLRRRVLVGPQGLWAETLKQKVLLDGQLGYETIVIRACVP